MFDPEDKWWYMPVCGLIYMLLNGIILCIEIKKRNITCCKKTKRLNLKSSHTQRFTALMEIISFVCIIGGVYNGFAIMTTYMPGFCFINDTMSNTALMVQPMSMGSYQLLRLYYCFSNNQIYSNKGYPLWVFYILGMIILILFIFFTFIAIVSDSFTLKCGYTNWEYYSFHKKNNFLRGIVFDIFLIISLSILLLWDMCTLCMYAWKVWYIKKNKNDDIQWIRIMRTLTRIYFLTLFYQYTGWILMLLFIIIIITNDAIIDIIYPFLLLIMSLSINISIYLMQKHNEKEYIFYLKILSWTRLYYLCCGCCCKSVIIDQCKEDDQLEENGKQQIPTGVSNTSIWNTADPYLKEKHSELVIFSMQTDTNIS